MKIQFVDDLPEQVSGRRARGKYEDFADALRENPGVWAVVPSKANPAGVVAGVCNGRLKGFQSGDFEAAVRNGKAYARFRGGQNG